MKIISGGQTGVDRAALDVALTHEIPCGGWCPEGRLDEFGRIPERYPVQELPNADFDERTLRNVIDSDATVIFLNGEIRGGTEHTLRSCRAYNRPHLLIDAAKVSVDDAATRIGHLIGATPVEKLNVAGPRESEWREGYDYAFAALEIFLQSSPG